MNDYNKPTSEQAWKIYIFINSWKKGDFGIIPLTEAIDKYFKDFKIKTSRNPYNLQLLGCIDCIEAEKFYEITMHPEKYNEDPYW